MDGGSNVASDQVIAELISMGFQISEATKAIKEVGPSLDVAVDFILNANANAKQKTNLPGTGKCGRVRQSSIMDHLQSGRPKIIKTSVSISDTHGEGCELVNTSISKAEEAGSDWEVRANTLLHHHFGYTSLKPFQKEALEAWIANKDCLVLAATGSVTCGEFDGSSTKDLDACGSSSIAGWKMKTELAQGSTIIYVPTRKETSSIANYLCRCSLIAAAYHAKLPKSQLSKVHKEFHESAIQVVVATIAFGMGIDKSNVRRIIHDGWPQSLEAYYQEAGRAGRDGKLADCDMLFVLLDVEPKCWYIILGRIL